MDVRGLAAGWWPPWASAPPLLCPPCSQARSLPLRLPQAERPPSFAAALCRRGRLHTGPGVEDGLRSCGPCPFCTQTLISSWWVVPTWLSWVPSVWAWAGSGHARQAHSSWMWLKQMLAVAAELLCLEEASMGSN